MGKVIVEIVGCSVEDCVRSERAGADRIELCSALSEGGLTPSYGLFHEATSRCSLPMMAMVRPRSGGFCYSESEFEQMKCDASALVDWGAPGIVFMVLQADGTIDAKRSEKLCNLAPDVQKVCHRAFDVTPDPRQALETLIDLGFSRVLTSGHRKSALEGADEIRSLIEWSNGRIEVLVGGGLRPSNVAQVVAKTGCRQVHLAPLATLTDPTSELGGEITYGNHTLADESDVAEVVRVLSA